MNFEPKFANKTLHQNGNEPVKLSQVELMQHIEHKQRVVAVGDSAHEVCTLSILLLQELGLGVDFLLSKKNDALMGTTRVSADANVILIEGGTPHQDGRGGEDCLNYEHHVGVLCDTEYVAGEQVLEKFLRALPKGGALFFPRGLSLERFLEKRNADVKYTEVNDVGEKKISGGELYLVLGDGETFLGNEYITPRVVGLSVALLKYFGFAHSDSFEALKKVAQRFF